MILYTHIRVLFISFILLLFSGKVGAQCAVVVDTAGIKHIECPNGGSTGFAALMQGTYTNYTWTNISNGQIYGNGPFVTSVSNLDAGTYIVMGSSPYGGCTKPTLTDTFEVYEPIPNIQLLPPQACPGDCNVSLVLSLNQAISPSFFQKAISVLKSLQLLIFLTHPLFYFHF